MKYIFPFLLLMLAFQACKKADSSVAPEEAVYGTVTGKIIEADGGGFVTKVNIKTNPSTSSVTSDSLGNYRLENISPGEYSVIAVKAGYDSASIKVKIIAGSNTIGDIFVQKYDPSRSLTTGEISGKVISLSGNVPLINALISTVPSTSNVTTDNSGNFSIKNVTPGQFTVTAVKSGFDTASIRVTVIKGQVATANLIMSPRDTSSSAIYGSIQGVITDGMTSSGVGGVTVVSDPATSSVFTDNSGKYVISNVSAGKYKITATKSGYTSTVTNVTVIAGKITYANIELLTTAGRIKGKVIDSDTGLPVSGVIIKTTPGTSTVTTNSTGDYEITQVTPATYTLTAEKTGYTTATVSITVKAGIITNADVALKP